MHGVIPEALASRKVVYRKVFTEGSVTAKVCTDQQVELGFISQYDQFGAYEARLSG